MNSLADNEETPGTGEAAAIAAQLAPVILANLTTRYPYNDVHLFRGEDPVDATLAHPAFGNSYDWHSSAHSHWTGVQLAAALTAGDDPIPEAEELGRVIGANLTADNLSVETAYLKANPAYERPYGWGWGLALAGIARGDLAAALAPLGQQIADNAIGWLGMLAEPVRHGVHSNTAFGLARMLDGARELGRDDLVEVIGERSRHWFADDHGWPGEWELSGNDFLSAGLVEADLMRRVLDPAEFAEWFDQFLPGLSTSDRILSVVQVPDVVDGQIVHLHGLNLSRGGCLARIAGTLADAGADDAVVAPLAERAGELYRAGLHHTLHGHYVSTHWLATFAWDAALSLDALAGR